VTCTACARAHLVNPKTDKWLAFELIVAMRAKRVLVPDASFFRLSAICCLLRSPMTAIWCGEEAVAAANYHRAPSRSGRSAW